MVLLGYAIMCLIFGTTFLAIKIGVDAGLPPFFSAGVRFLAAGLILMIWMYARKKVSFSLLLRKETLFIGSGLTFFTFAALYWAEQYITSGVGAVLSATAPAIILLMRAVVLKDKAPSISFIGAMIGLVGVALLMLPGLSGQYHALWVIACLVVVLGQFGYAGGAVYSKQVVAKLQGSSPIAQNAAQMMHGGWMLLVLSLITERGQIHVEAMFNSAAIGSLLYLIVLGSMGGHTLFYWLISRTNPVFPSTWLYISPMIALVLGWLIYKEPLNWIMGLGALIILIGVILTNIETLRSLFANRWAKASRDQQVPIVKVYKN